MKPRVLSTARLSFPLATAIAALLTMQSANAAAFYWDNNTGTAGFSTASGTWAQNSTTTGRWTTSPTGVLAGSLTQVTANTDTFNFGTATNGLGAGSITVSGGVTMGSTTYGSASGAIVLTGGTITYSAAPTITVNNTTNTINSIVAGAATSFTKAGTGALILGGANTFAGATTVSAGLLTLSNSLALQNSALDTTASSASSSATTGLKTTVTTLTFGGLSGNKDLVSLFNAANGYSSVTTLTLNPGRTVSYSGAIANGAMNLIKSGAGTQTLSGTNTYGGTTNINGGILNFANKASKTAAVATVATAGSVGLGVNVSDAAYYSATDVGDLFNSSLAGFAMNAASGVAIDTTNAGATFDQTVALTAPRALTKLGTGTLLLSQTNTYSGTTTIDEGTLALGVDHNLAGGLTFGSTAGTTTTGALDLTSANATFSSLLVQTSTAGNNTITIGSGKTLTLTGSTVTNVLTVGGSTSGSAKLQVTGATAGVGTLTVTDSTRNIVVASTDTATATTQTLDLSGLGTFNATIANLYVGNPRTTAGAATVGRPPNDSLTLAVANTITAGGTNGIVVGGATTTGGTAKLILGTTNALNATRFVIGASRTSGTMEFNTGLTNPTVTIRGAAGGSARTDIYLGDQGGTIAGISQNGGGSTAITGTMNLTGGSVDARIGSLYLGMGGTVTSNNRASGNGIFTMDGASSSVDINTLVIAQSRDDTSTTTAASATVSTSAFTMNNGSLQVNTAVTLANDIDTSSAATGNQNLSATFTVAGGTATIGSLSTPVNLIFGNHINAGNSGLATAAVSLTGGTLNVFGNIQEGNLGAGTITSSLAINGASAILDMKGGNITDLDTITYTSGTLKNLGVVNTGMALAGGGFRVFDQATGVNGDIQGTITGTGVGLDKQGLGKLTLSGTNTYDGVTTVTAATLQFAKEASLYNATPASWTATNINVKSTATLALNVDSAGIAGFTSGSIDTLLSNISVANTATEGLQAGATLGLDTSTATAATFTQGNAIADSTGANGGAIGLTKSGAGTLVLDKANSYSGVTTLAAGTLELANATAAGTAAGGIIISGATAAILQINSGITTGDNITFSNTNVGSKVVRDVAVTTAYNTGTTGILKSNFTPVVDLYADTTAEILDGTRTLGTTLEMLFADTAPTATNDGIRRSDVFGTNGTSSDTYVIQLSTGALAGDSVLGWLNGTNWVHAGTNFFNASYTSAVRVVGDYGYDSGNVWAVVDHGGSFSAVPEPTSAFVGLLIGAGLLRRRRATHHNL